MPLHTLSPLLSKHEVTLDIIKSDKQTLDTYPGAWVKITSNLVENSIKHGFKNHLRNKTATIKIYNDESHHYFSFKDNGQGMDFDTQQKIFEAFFTTNRANGGTGLGLFVVSNIVTQQLAGKIVCSSEVGAGTEFLIKVPSAIHTFDKQEQLK